VKMRIESGEKQIRTGKEGQESIREESRTRKKTRSTKPSKIRKMNASWKRVRTRSGPSVTDKRGGEKRKIRRRRWGREVLAKWGPKAHVKGSKSAEAAHNASSSLLAQRWSGRSAYQEKGKRLRQLEELWTYLWKGKRRDQLPELRGRTKAEEWMWQEPNLPPFINMSKGV